ncbi:MAG: hypothetical protein ACFCVG_00580 [Kineosporiaceae bacterium]
MTNTSMLQPGTATRREGATRGAAAWTRRRLGDLATLLADRGPEAAVPQLVELAVAARDAGLNTHVVDLLIDPHAPTVSRERAFAHVARRLDR